MARLLGRAPTGAFEVVVRRRDGSPVVIMNAPFLQDGRPMPTLYWLLDSELCDAVSRIESAGGVKASAAELDPNEIEASHDRYRNERDRHIPLDHRGPRPSGGVGGTRKGIKCLHAHLAWHLAGGDDPVGRWVVGRLDIDMSAFVTQAE